MRQRFVFDFGQVLFRWQPEQLLRRLWPQRLHDEASSAHWVSQVFQGYGGDWGEFDRGRVDVAELTRRLSRRIGVSTGEVASLIEAIRHELAPIAELVELLAELRSSGRPVYFLSNMPEPFAAHLETMHAFVAWFADGIFSSRVRLGPVHATGRDHVDSRKGRRQGAPQPGWTPGEDLQRRMRPLRLQPCGKARRFGVAPADLVFLDDHAPNVDAARRAGWQALQFSDAASCRRELRTRGLWPA